MQTLKSDGTVIWDKSLERCYFNGDPMRACGTGGADAGAGSSGSRDPHQDAYNGG